MRHDPDRLALLRKLMILDSSREGAYDDIAQRLASSLEVPIAMVSILDVDRDWFKASVGFPEPESPAVTSFCDTFFKTCGSMIVVEDTTKDERFSNHPLVTAGPRIRFYAAARLSIRGHTVGTLCAYDVQPRKLSVVQLDQLRTLAVAAMERLDERLKPKSTN